MAPRQIQRVYVCHRCSVEYFDRASLISHLVDCRPDRSLNNENNRIPRLNKFDQEILQSLKLKRSTNFHSLRSKSKIKPIEQKEKSFPFSQISLLMEFQVGNEIERSINNNNRTNCFHFYKYSRREQLNFYASVKRARLKKNCRIPISNSSKIDCGPFSIEVPTKIQSRQRLNSTSKQIFPLIFDPNFESLVKLSENVRMKIYSATMKKYFHLLHSIASQEFQLIVHSHDRLDFSSNGRSFIEILRETMFHYSKNYRQTLNEDYFRLIGSTNEISVDRSKSLSTNENIEENKSSNSNSNPKSNVKVRTRNDSSFAESQTVSFSVDQISEQWSKKNVFYRCHACSHEQFFLALSRECLKLHLSSKHAENEDNFKQHLSSFINREGRSLKIVQHYLKWQKPWTENEIQRIFRLSNSNIQCRSF